MSTNLPPPSTSPASPVRRLIRAVSRGQRRPLGLVVRVLNRVVGKVIPLNASGNNASVR